MGKAFSPLRDVGRCAVVLRREIAFFSAIKDRDQQVHHGGQEAQRCGENNVPQTDLDNAIVADGVADILRWRAWDKPNIGLLSEEFLEDVRQMKTEKRSGLELLEKLLRDEIKAQALAPMVQGKRNCGDAPAGDPAQVSQPLAVGGRRRLIETDPDGHGSSGRCAGARSLSLERLRPGRDCVLRCTGQQRERGARKLGDDTLQKKIAVENHHERSLPASDGRPADLARASSGAAAICRALPNFLQRLRQVSTRTSAVSDAAELVLNRSCRSEHGRAPPRGDVSPANNTMLHHALKSAGARDDLPTSACSRSDAQTSFRKSPWSGLRRSDWRQPALFTRTRPCRRGQGL